ncbi:MAG: DoxX family protein [Steroidobacteraceae bacterium]
MSGRDSVDIAGRQVDGRRRSRQIGLGFVFLWFLLGGIAHFAATRLEMRIVPPYIHWPRVAVLLSGVCELLGAAGLLYRPTRRAAGAGLFVLTLAVTPANVYMLQRHDLFHVPYWLLVLRLPLQLGLLALIAWSAIGSSRQGPP